METIEHLEYEFFVNEAKSVEALTSQFSISFMEDKSKYGMIFNQQKINLPYGTKIQLEGIENELVIGDKENDDQCKKYYDFSEGQAIKPITIKLPKGVDVMWMEKGNEKNYYHEVSKEEKEYTLKLGYFTLPENTPVRTKKTFLTLNEQTSADVDYGTFFE